MTQRFPSGTYPPCFIGPDGDLDAVACVELAHQGSEMRLDGADADMQLIGDLAVGPALGDRDQDLLLPVGERLEGEPSGVVPTA